MSISSQKVVLSKKVKKTSGENNIKIVLIFTTIMRWPFHEKLPGVVEPVKVDHIHIFMPTAERWWYAPNVHLYTYI